MTDKEIHALYADIRKLLREFGNAFNDYVLNESYYDYADEDDRHAEENRIKDRMLWNLNRLANNISVLLEILRLEKYLTLFDSSLRQKLSNLSAVVAGEYNDENDEVYSALYAEIASFLSPFTAMWPEEQTKAVEDSVKLAHLENILKATGFITSKLSLPPTSEPQVYRAVRTHLMAIFPSCIEASSSFLWSLKYYKPDILVPECSAAVEYKYADSDERLKAVIGQISDDVKGYRGDARYENFYAVFYLTDQFHTGERLQHLWDEKDFPSCWKAIFCVGKPRRKGK